MKRDVYLALGDSITAGHGATHPRYGFTAYVSRFTRQRNLTTRTMVIAKNGWTSKDILRVCHTLPPELFQQTRVLTLLTGGNDLRKLLRRQYLSFSGSPLTESNVEQQVREYEFYMDRIFHLLVQYPIPHVLVGTVYNPAPNFPIAVGAMTKLRDVTRRIGQRYQVPVVDVYERFDTNEAYLIEGYRMGRLEDLSVPFRRPIHPNNTGHKAIADLFTSQLRQRLAVRKKRANL